MITLLNRFDDGYIMKEEDIRQIINEYKKNYGLEEYVRDVSFKPHSKYPAFYNTKDRIISFDDKRCIRAAYKYFDELYNNYPIDEDNYTYYINNYFLYIIYHELTHAEDLKRYEINYRSNDVFCELYDACNNIRKDDYRFYEKKHNYFPMEINAIHNGLLSAYKIMQHTKLPTRECRVLYAEYLSMLYYYYNKDDEEIITSPVETLARMSKLIDFDRVNDMLNNSSLSKMERINLGLPITLKEYSSLINKEEKVKSLIK